MLAGRKYSRTATHAYSRPIARAPRPDSVSERMAIAGKSISGALTYVHIYVTSRLPSHLSFSQIMSHAVRDPPFDSASLPTPSDDDSDFSPSRYSWGNAMDTMDDDFSSFYFMMRPGIKTGGILTQYENPFGLLAIGTGSRELRFSGWKNLDDGIFSA